MAWVNNIFYRNTFWRNNIKNGCEMHPWYKVVLDPTPLLIFELLHLYSGQSVHEETRPSIWIHSHRIITMFICDVITTFVNAFQTMGKCNLSNQRLRRTRHEVSSAYNKVDLNTVYINEQIRDVTGTDPFSIESHIIPLSWGVYANKKRCVSRIQNRQVTLKI